MILTSFQLFLFFNFSASNNVRGPDKHYTYYREIMTIIAIDYYLISFIFLNNVRRYQTSLEPLT